MSASENGWQPAKARADQCVWVTIPGTTVSLQLLQGQPMAIMRAFAADFNTYVEPLRDADTAGWTPTNSVATSNHLNGTAMDLNWNSHPFRILNAGFTSGQINTIRDMLAFYEETIWWGNDWNEPRDAMHFQMGYDTYGDPHTADFIARKIRADGYSTFRRGGGQPTPLPKKDQYALAIIAEGQRRGVTPRGIQIALATALVESNLVMYANSSVPESLALPHEAVGSDHDSVGLFQQRCPMWGPAAVLMDATQSAGLFYDHLEGLDYTNTDETPGYWAQAVQRSAFPDRYDQRFADAVALYERLATTGGGIFMALSDAEQRELLDLARQQSGYRRVSRSPLRHVGEGPTETATGFELNVDGSVHVLLVNLLARLGDPDALALLNEVANLNPAVYPDRVHDKQLARAVLNDIAGQATADTAPSSGQTPGTIPTPVSVPPAPIAVPPPPVQVPPPPPTVPPTGGGISSGVNAVDTDLATLRAVLADLTQQIRS